MTRIQKTEEQTCPKTQEEEKEEEKNLELFLLLGELCLEPFHQVLHGVAGRADVGLLLGRQLHLEAAHLLLHLAEVAPLLLRLGGQSLHLGGAALLQPAEGGPVAHVSLPATEHQGRHCNVSLSGSFWGPMADLVVFFPASCHPITAKTNTQRKSR